MILSLLSTEIMKKKVSILYFLPTRTLAESIIWTGRTNEGMPYLDIFPSELIAHKDNRNMRITFINGSVIQFLGTDYCENVGQNANIIVFSEFFISKFEAFEVVSPIVRMNNGRIIWLGTIRGKNEAYELLQASKKRPDVLTIDFDIRDTGVVSREDIQFDIDTGIIGYRKALREYYNVVFDEDEENAVYKYSMELMRQEGRIGEFNYNPSFPVYCMFDLGVADLTTITFFQYIDDKVYIIDYYENNGKPTDWYAKYLRGTYNIDRIFLPFDGNQRGKVSAETPAQIFREHGYSVLVVGRDKSVKEGIERTKEFLNKISIDRRCRNLIGSMERYGYPHTASNKKYSHASDNVRGISKIVKDGYIRVPVFSNNEKSSFQMWLDWTDRKPENIQNWAEEPFNVGVI